MVESSQISAGSNRNFMQGEYGVSNINIFSKTSNYIIVVEKSDPL